MKKNKLDGLYAVPWVNSEGKTCIICKHFISHGCCKAFPDGIPPQIWLGEVTHSKPLKGDRGIIFTETDSGECELLTDENIFSKPTSKRQ